VKEIYIPYDVYMLVYKKVKWSHSTPRMTLGERGCIALIFLNFDTRRGRVVHTPSRALSAGKGPPVLTVQEAG
jgi:hypothetical protein